MTSFTKILLLVEVTARTRDARPNRAASELGVQTIDDVLQASRRGGTGAVHTRRR
jgi:hypothetical protein